jgi:hypothetical protein
MVCPYHAALVLSETCDGRNLRKRVTWAFKRMPPKSAEWLGVALSFRACPERSEGAAPAGPAGRDGAPSGVPLVPARSQHVISGSICKVKDEQLLADGSCSKITSTVLVCSTERRKRNHVESGTRRTRLAWKPARSRASMPNPPPCKSKSAAPKVCSMFRHRTHNKCFESMPVRAKECGSSASLPSTSAHTSPWLAMLASMEINRPVRPEDSGPQISVNPPRGMPPVTASSSEMSVGTVSRDTPGQYLNGAGNRPSSADSILARSTAAFIKVGLPLYGVGHMPCRSPLGRPALRSRQYRSFAFCSPLFCKNCL